MKNTSYLIELHSYLFLETLNVADMGRGSGTDSDFKVIEFHMLNKSTFFPLALTSGFVLRFALYPLTLVKTRIQLQKHNEMYSGTWDAFRKIMKYEGPKGLYRGFGVNCMMILPSLAYIGTYEGVRDNLKKVSTLSGNYRALCAGCFASMMSQTFIVPIDIVSQYLMVFGPQKPGAPSPKVKPVLPLSIPPDVLESRSRLTYHIIRSIHQQYGLFGFYRGYFISLMTYAPSSALWWFFYDSYCCKYQKSLI